MQAKAALVSVNIFKDDGLGNHCFPLSNIRLNIYFRFHHLLLWIYDTTLSVVFSLLNVDFLYFKGDDDMNCYIDDKNDIHNLGRFLNRLLGIAPETQNRFVFCDWNDLILLLQHLVEYTNFFCINRLFELFVNILDLLVNKARIEGNLDTGIVDLKANVIELQGTPKVFNFVLNFLLPLKFKTEDKFPLMQTVYVDKMSGASTVLFTFTLDRGVSWEVHMLS